MKECVWNIETEKAQKQDWDKHHFHITTLHKYIFVFCFYTLAINLEVVFNVFAKLPSQSCFCAFSVLIFHTHMHAVFF